MTPATVTRISYALAALVIVVGVVLWLATDRAVFFVFAVIGALTALGGYFANRPRPTDKT